MESLQNLVRLRRALHQMPELSESEHKTSDFIYAELTKLGYKPHRMKTGMVVDKPGKNRQKRIALRADIDALPIEEKSGCGFESTNGNMHACGHDGHTAMLLEVARLLSARQPVCDVRLIFQFGEEGSGGAEQMIAMGAIEKTDEIYAFHLCPDLPVGHAASSAGALFAGAVEFDVDFTGRSSHCASPEQGKDALKAAVSFAAQAPMLNHGYQNNTLFHMGSLHSGNARNIVADFARTQCTLRYFDENEQEAVMMHVASALTKTDTCFGTEHRVTVHAVYPPLINGGGAYATVKRVFPTLEDIAPRYTAEDFAFYAQRISGCMVWLGCKDDRYFAPLHADNFGFDEQALLTGIDIYQKLIF